MKVEKIDKSGCWYAFEITDGDETISVYQPKCRCMSCEYLDVVIKDDDGERKYELYTYDNGNQKLDDMINLLCKLSDFVGGKS